MSRFLTRVKLFFIPYYGVESKYKTHIYRRNSLKYINIYIYKHIEFHRNNHQNKKEQLQLLQQLLEQQNKKKIIIQLYNF